MENQEDLTLLIKRASDDKAARDELYRKVYDSLRSRARSLLHRRRSSEVQTTMIVNEVLLKFEKADTLGGMPNRRVFFSVATTAMKNVLIDHYRSRKKNVDSPDRESNPLDSLVADFEERTNCDLEELAVVLEDLEQDSPRQHAVVMHRFFGELKATETADILGVSLGTVERDWRLAKAKLYRALRKK